MATSTKHIFLEEVFEQPESVKNTIEHAPRLIDNVLEKIGNHIINNVILVGCGDPHFLSYAGKFAFQEFAKLSCASYEGLEFALYPPPNLDSKTIIIGISQSGKTLQIIEALKIGKSNGCPTIAMTNMPDSPITQFSDNVIITKAGLSRSFPTKTTTCLLTLLYMLSLSLGKYLGKIDTKKFDYVNQQIKQIPNLIQQTLSQEQKIKTLADSMSCSTHFRYVATGPAYSAASYGSAKIKEIVQTYSEANQLEEFIHMHAFSIQKGDPIFFIAPSVKTSIRGSEIAKFSKEHLARVIAILAPGQVDYWKNEADEVFELGPSEEIFHVFSEMVLFQLFAYYLSLAKSRNPDRPIGYDERKLQKLIYSDLLEGWFS